MSNIFDDSSDSDVNIRTDNQYAKTYDTWRKKEEINKLKTKYGDNPNLEEDYSSSSSEDEEGIELTEEIEKDFFKTLACLKNKDPKIYNENIFFFQEKGQTTQMGKKKTKKESPMYLKDYERKMILEKGGILSDEESGIQNESKSVLTSATYVEEENRIKEMFKNAINEDDEDGEELLKKRKNAQKEEKENSDYKKWLIGMKEKIDDTVETELKPLKDYWNNPKLDESEKFLRDYLLSKKFLEKSNDDYIPTYDEVIHDSDEDLSNDEDTIDKQEEFEHKYNFRFEEPDQEFIKRYPRTLENSARKKDDRRKLKRQEIKERKAKEKKEKMRELKKLQELKRKEIEEKLEKLKEITGNADIEFKNEDIDGDFDPDAHDKRMQALFNDEYYQGPEETQKPVFPEIDEELEIESWDKYEGENADDTYTQHCEDEDFNMDCDYDPTTSAQNELLERSKGKKKRKRKSKVAEALSKPKPKFDPNDKNYEKYFDEYYKLDCEDIIGDIPCRFKYRTVLPNDFGLSVEEILLAKERELNKWCSLKKAVQIRPDHVEKYDQIAYKKKAQNLYLKKKILPSLFMPENEEENIEESDNNLLSRSDGAHNLSEQIKINENVQLNQSNNIINNKTAIKKKKKMKKPEKPMTSSVNNENVTTVKDFEKSVSQTDTKRKTENINIHDKNQSYKEKRKRKISSNTNESEASRKKIKKNRTYNNKKEVAISDARLSAYGINPKKFKNKIKFSKK